MTHNLILKSTSTTTSTLSSKSTRTATFVRFIFVFHSSTRVSSCNQIRSSKARQRKESSRVVIALFIAFSALVSTPSSPSSPRTDDMQTLPIDMPSIHSQLALCRVNQSWVCTKTPVAGQQLRFVEWKVSLSVHWLGIDRNSKTQLISRTSAGGELLNNSVDSKNRKITTNSSQIF